MKKIEAIIKGLDILKKYSDDVTLSGREVIAGPYMFERVPEEKRIALDEMKWIFEDGVGWSLYV